MANYQGGVAFAADPRPQYGRFASELGKRVGYVTSAGAVSGLQFIQEGSGSDPFNRLASTSWKKIYRDRIRTEFVPINDRKWNNYRQQVDKKLGAEPESAWERYCARCEFYGLNPQPWIVEVNGSLNAAMDGEYVEMGVENGHIKFQRLKDDDGYPDEISWHLGHWCVMQLIPHVSNTAVDTKFFKPKRIVREYVRADLSIGLPPVGTGPEKDPWTHTTTIAVSGGPKFVLPQGAILASHATYDPVNGIYNAQDDGTYVGMRGWSLFNDGEGWKFENDGTYYYQASSLDGPWTIEKDFNYSGRASRGKGPWQKFILAHNDQSKSSFPVVSGQ